MFDLCCMFVYGFEGLDMRGMAADAEKCEAGRRCPRTCLGVSTDV